MFIEFNFKNVQQLNRCNKIEYKKHEQYNLFIGRHNSFSLLQSRKKRQVDPSDPYPVDEEFATPWQFVQASDGRIVDVGFASTDTDEEAQNFKRAITSAFQSQFNTRGSRAETTDVTGRHTASFRYGHFSKMIAKLKKPWLRERQFIVAAEEYTVRPSIKLVVFPKGC